MIFIQTKSSPFKPQPCRSGVSLGMVGGTLLGGLSGHHGFEQRHPNVVVGIQQARHNEDHHRNAWLEFMDRHDAWSAYDNDYDDNDI
jgi:hypothetical protein